MTNSAIVITYYKNCILCLHEEMGVAKKLMIFPDEELHIKSVYVGKVKNIVKNIGAAFVEIAPGKVCYLNLNECKDLVVLNRVRKEVDLHQGDEIPVQIIKGAVKNKVPVCSGIIRLPKALKSEIIEKAKTRKPFSVLYSGNPEYLSFFDGIDLNEVDKITCVDDALYQEVDAYLDNEKLKKAYDEATLKRLRENTFIYTDDYPLEKLYKIESLILEVKNRQIWLKSGANIVIEYTEAMTVIDVNSAKSIKDKDANHILAVNKEAATEIFRQIKLRNLSGMILVDFINDTEENTLLLVEEIKKLTELDNVRTEFIDVTKLGIVEITRAKKYRPIHEILREL